jgi:hypothetical protein
VKDLAVLASLSEIQPVPIADLRFVPLAELPDDSHAHRNARRVMEPLDEPSRIQVATFNSAI